MDLTVGPDLFIRGKGKSLLCDTRNVPQHLNTGDFKDAESINRVYSHIGRKLALPTVSKKYEDAKFSLYSAQEGLGTASWNQPEQRSSKALS